MAEKKTLKYYFSTEGKTEQYYLEHLQNLINSCAEAAYKVSFTMKPISPKSYVKRINILNKSTIFHLFDFESNESEFETHFKNVLAEMRAAEKLGKKVIYKNGYSNLTFELWILLHKTDLNRSFANRKNYLSHINKIFGTKYQSLNEYKEEKHFKSILQKLTLDDVISAVNRMKNIIKNNIENGYKKKSYLGYVWYSENPSSELGDIIGSILKDCGIKLG